MGSVASVFNSYSKRQTALLTSYYRNHRIHFKVERKSSSTHFSIESEAHRRMIHVSRQVFAILCENSHHVHFDDVEALFEVCYRHLLASCNSDSANEFLQVAVQLLRYLRQNLGCEFLTWNEIEELLLNDFDGSINEWTL